MPASSTSGGASARVKNTQQITKAMKMVSAAKLRRAQEAMFAARPYARQMLRGAGQPGRAREAATRASAARSSARDSASCWSWSPPTRACAGGFNANLIRAAERFLERAQGAATSRSTLVGRKGRDFFRAPPVPRSAPSTSGVFQALQLSGGARRSPQDAHRRLRQRRGRRGLPRSTTSSRASSRRRSTVERLLPIPRHRRSTADGARRSDYIYEPGPAEIFERMLPRARRDRRSTGRCSSRRPPSTPRAWPPWTRPPTNAGEMIDALTLVHEPGAPGHHHQGDHRSGVGERRRAVASGSGSAGRGSYGHRRTSVESFRSSGPPWTSSSPTARCPPIYNAVRITSDDGSTAACPSTSSPRSSSTSARTACAASPCSPPTAWCAA